MCGNNNNNNNNNGQLVIPKLFGKKEQVSLILYTVYFSMTQMRKGINPHMGEKKEFAHPSCIDLDYYLIRHLFILAIL